MDKEQLSFRSFTDTADGEGLGVISSAWNLLGTPTLFVLDHNGLIRYSRRGIPDAKVIDEVLNKLAAVIRERFNVKRQIHAISAQGRASAWILGLLPLAIAGALFVITPHETKAFVDDPLGFRMIVVALALQAVGVVIIRRIISVEY